MCVREALTGTASPEEGSVNLTDVVTGAEETTNASSKATKTEFEVAFLIGIVGLGVGIGCALAGYFSGNRLELGLVPIGLTLLILNTALMAVLVPDKMKMVACLIAIGAAAGFYIVPLYTLLQHRSPKDSKGSLVATSNFFNVTGGLIAVIVFFLVTWSLQLVMGLNLSMESVKHTPELIGAYLHQLSRAAHIPKLLFLTASMITVLMLGWLRWQRPDFTLRAVAWLRSSRQRHLRGPGTRQRALQRPGDPGQQFPRLRPLGACDLGDRSLRTIRRARHRRRRQAAARSGSQHGRDDRRRTRKCALRRKTMPWRVDS